ncbi:MAG: DNA topoisomerase IV subunit A, partial [Spirochaetaceae bacterium]|nr:DNA topoisomerase IV subunit A [Spirochaetaceae bacterium]
VQRRILQCLFEMDDGRFNKVANVVGECMKYHPHGDASIYEALVVLANKQILLDRQGNFGNIFTGDPASAARYIECRVLPLAKQLLYNPKLTTFENSYDDRRQEPVTFPAKIPLILVLGTEGIAVGMATRILPHNFIEVMQAVIAALRGKKFQLYPDFPTGGDMDVSGYEDGNGKVLVRAKLDTSDPKRIVIRELPYGCTTKSLIASIEAAARKGTLKIAGISDFTTDKVEIEIRLQRGTYAADVVDVLYAFTDCEVSIPVNFLVIKDNVPVEMRVTEVIEYHAKKLVAILKAELQLEQAELLDRLHMRTLEQIFVEERIYKSIEQKKTQEAVTKAVLDGLKPFAKQIKREVTEEDVERLLKIPIRRISLYDITKAKKEMEEIRARLGEIKYHLGHLTDYAAGFLDGIIEAQAKGFPRATQIRSFQKVDVREAAQRNLKLRYDEETGYIGTGISGGTALFEVSAFDKIIVIRKSGMYTVQTAPEKLFVDKGALYCGFAEKEEIAKKIFSVIYKDPKTKIGYIKRARIETWILDKPYELIPEGMELLKLTSKEDAAVHVEYEPARGLKKLEETFLLKKFPVRGLKAAGLRIAPKKIKTAVFVKKQGKK